MAETIHTTRRGILKWLPIAGAAVAAGNFPAQAFAPVNASAESVFEAIASTVPAGHRCIAVIIKPTGIEATACNASGAMLYRIPTTGQWV
jgi:hypothetical protein